MSLLNTQLAVDLGGVLKFKTPRNVIGAELTAIIIGAGGSGGQLDYEFVQNTPLATWIINHNLGRRVTTDVYTLGGVKVMAEVVNVSNNQVQVLFDAPFSGYAIIN